MRGIFSYPLAVDVFSSLFIFDVYVKLAQRVIGWKQFRIDLQRCLIGRNRFGLALLIVFQGLADGCVSISKVRIEFECLMTSANRSVNVSQTNIRLRLQDIELLSLRLQFDNRRKLR